ncbi:MAG: hypothetical protein JWN44_1992 [Myxococcales bacterium]|nr:hypothetical protein [Myxococcales bacterium]
MRCGRLVLLLTIVNVNAGCLDQIVPLHERVEEPQVQRMLSQRTFEGSGFLPVGQAAFDSDLEPDKKVTMFVSRAAVAAYSAVSPEADATSGPAFPIGGVIVRDVSDASGAPTGLTVMVKREPGYFPEAGDFFFGVTDLAGVPVNGEDGVEWGALASCATCHHTRAAAGYLFGVPQSAR